VASSLLSPDKREAYAAEVRADYAKISAAHFRAQADKKRLKLADARANAVAIDFAKAPPNKPAFLGIKSFRDYDLAELAEYIDWTPFFQTWELTGRFPAILDDAKVGEVARSLYDDAREMLDRFKNANDDYSSILCKALADRLAEAFAERMHLRVRKEFWGYAPDEALSPEQLILEQYQGIRPAPGYPAQPDHTEKATLFSLLDAENTAGVKLTENYAMWPGSSVSGLYFSHRESFYFGVGKIERDQVEDYASRKGWNVIEAERW